MEIIDWANGLTEEEAKDIRDAISLALWEKDMVETKGRVDWMPRLKMWKVILYQGNKDIEVGRATTKETATLILQDVIAERRKVK